MPRPNRYAPAGYLFHVVNRSVRRATLFQKDSDYLTFEETLFINAKIHRARILTYCVMPNHWHLVLWPRFDGELQKFMHCVTFKHAKIWHREHKTEGTGHVYQDRYKSFVINTDEYLTKVGEYIENNPVRAGLVIKREDWKWSSAGLRTRGLAHLLANINTP